tara:strand:+ start:1496 stop:1675 length:180 start_codon:yes stop_codon:yes gene_type:complete
MGQSNASNGAKDIDAFNEGNLEGVNTHDNFGYKDMPADFRKRYKEMLEQHNKKKNKKKK